MINLLKMNIFELKRIFMIFFVLVVVGEFFEVFLIMFVDVLLFEYLGEECCYYGK